MKTVDYFRNNPDFIELIYEFCEKENVPPTECIIIMNPLLVKRELERTKIEGALVYFPAYLNEIAPNTHCILGLIDELDEFDDFPYSMLN